MACGLGYAIRAIYDPKTEMPHYRFNDQQVATMEGFLLAKTDSDFLANVHLDARDTGAGRARQEPGDGVRLCFLS